MRLSGHAYPWDVLGDEAFVDRVHSIGVPEVTLAAAYHSTRAATPLHPRHQIVDARSSALYRPIRDDVWNTKLRPAAPHWMDAADPYREAAEVLVSADLRVRAWVVLNHDSLLGTANPGLAVSNCFADRYRYALCPANPEVRHYAATLAAEAVRDAPCDAISLEGCGQLGIGHVSQHDKTAGAWNAAAARWLSVCCCPACRSQWRAAQLDPHEVITSLRRAVTTQAHGDSHHEVPEELAEALLRVRHESFDLLRAEVLNAIREVAGSVPVTLHASPDPWATGPASGITTKAIDDVDALLVPAWPTTRQSATTVTDAAASDLPIDAYVTALSLTDPDELSPHVARLIAAGAGGIAFYHLGLANAAQQRAIASVIDELD